MRCMVTKDALLADYALFFDEGTDAVRRKRGFEEALNKIIGLGFLRPIESTSAPAYEVRRILKAKIGPEQLEQVKQQLAAHAERLA